MSREAEGLTRSRGQAALELAIVLPVLLIITLGSWDLSRMASNAGVATGEARAGLRTGAKSLAADIGSAVRTAADPEIANTVVVWGQSGLGKTDDGCFTGVGSCGDPGGCISGSAFWNTVPTPVACFAVATCTLAGPPFTCPPGPWGARPPVGSGAALDVRVVLHFSPMTPVLKAAIGGGVITIVRDGYGTINY